MDKQIRIANPADAETIARMLDACHTECGLRTPGVEVLADRLRKQLKQNTMYVVIAGAPAVSFGLATLRPSVWADGPTVSLDEVYTAPDHRNQGFGARVLRELVREAQLRNAKEIVVAVGSEGAQRFYVRHEFVVEDGTVLLRRDV